MTIHRDRWLGFVLITCASLAPLLAPLGVNAQAAPVAPAATAPEPAATPAATPEPAPVLAPAPAPLPEPAPVIAPEPPPVVAPPPAEPPAAPPAVTAPVAPPPAPPPLLIPTGSFFGRYEVRANYDELAVSTTRPRFSEGDAFFYRLRLGLATAPIEVASGTNVILQFTPQATGMMGVLGGLPNTLVDAPLGLHEGYLRVATSAFRFDIGRFELNYGDALVLGNVDWNETGRSFDGMRARVSPDGATGYYVDVFGTQVDEGKGDGLNTPFAAGDQYLLGVYAGLGPAITAGLDFDLYALAQIFPTADGYRLVATDPTMSANRESAAEGTFGVRAKQRVGMIDYRAEAGMQVGERVPAITPMVVMTAPTTLAATKSFAYQLDAEVGVYALEDKLRFALEGLVASGDDPTTADKIEGWNEMYPTAHKFLGLSDIFHQGGQKRTNVLSGVLHVTAKPTAELTFQVDGHLFSRLEAPTDDKFAGIELDAGVTYALGKGLNLKGLYAVFVPDADLYPVMAAAADEKPAHYLELELRYDLK